MIVPLGLVGQVSPALCGFCPNRDSVLRPPSAASLFPMRSNAEAREAQMAGTCVINYPPTTNYPYLVVTFLPDRSLQATPFDSEEEASAFIDRVAPSPQLPI